MTPLDFLVVNSFATRHFGGNPAAVFIEAGVIDKTVMQAIARQMNLVETVFVLPADHPTADFRLLYFTPEEELPVAGHPTIAACIALAYKSKIISNLDKTYRVQTGKGVVTVLVSATNGGPAVFMEQPVPVFGAKAMNRCNVAEVLGLTEDDLLPALPVVPVDTGLGHLIVPVKSLQALMKIRRNIDPLKLMCAELGVREVQAFTFEVHDAANQLHTRNICPREGIEDPACGVGNGALAAYLLQFRYADRTSIEINAEQGDIVGMPGIIISKATRHADGFTVTIGGSGRVMIEGLFYTE